MYWIAISPRLSRGRSTPEIRAILSILLSNHFTAHLGPPVCLRHSTVPQLALPLTLALLVARVLADDAHDALAPHDLAVLAPNLDGRSDFHLMSFRAISPLVSGTPGCLRHSAALHLALLFEPI